jgi:hypothetical protein
MKQLVRIALLASIVIGALCPALQPASALEAKAVITRHSRWEGPCQGFALGETLKPAFALAHPGIASAREHALADCVFAKWGRGYAVPTSVIQRESGWWPWAKNPDTATACLVWDVSYVPFGSCGLSQQMAQYWPGRVVAYLQPAWFPTSWPQISPLDMRANLIAMAKMWDGGGCPGPWCSPGAR